VNLLLKRYDAAITDYDAALKIRSDDAYSLFGRGAAKFKKGDLKGADADVVQAQALKPDIAEYMAVLGIQLGNTLAAARDRYDVLDWLFVQRWCQANEP